ncbi:MAG: UDP-N-acetylmuramoyl-tripeptide--D-alanyl-D-alanine ligase [Deltaproteobacteria bacterium]|nr:UDP-N-acetylmuramoyl-tripeptide--D-alanyl-D-alanine ligase [Deltaproteobacteria bacterium]MDZ4347509.1 UDP-N-acetylmuramoyl-tripeptide--D-alanyl-D-alanine ligase [Candidatus Binatia bacterium]
MGWSQAEILAATGGKIARQGHGTRFGEVMTDSNKVKNGSVFVALKGERHDGHRFVGEAVRRGARCVIIHRSMPVSALGQATAVRVRDTLRALGDLAHYRREKIAPKVLAITGSNGKTTTKEMVAAILEEARLDGQSLRSRVLKTDGNFNNLVGLPLTLLRLRRGDKVAVVELGTNHPGEIQRLAEIADPDMGIITSVGAAHLEGLNSLAGVAREKGALYQNIRAGGAIAVNLDDPWVKRLGARFKGRKITYGNRGHVRARSQRMRGAQGQEVTLQAGRERCRVGLNYLGRHNITNALGAAALTLGAGVGLVAVRRGLAKVRPFPMRMQIEIWRGVGIINDTYNANPTSMNAALETLTEIDCRGHKIAVLGDMFELGKHSAKEHRSLGQRAAKAGVDALYLLGDRSVEVRKGALQSGMRAEQIIIGRNHTDLARRLRDRVQRGDWLLFKGSRGMKMEKVLHELKGEKT